MSNLSTAQRLDAAEKQVGEMTAQLTTANAELVTLRAELEAAKGTVAAHEAKISGLNKTNTDLTASLNTATADLAAVKGENETLNAKEQDIEKRATAKAAAICAGLGITHAPLAVGAPSGSTSTKTEKPASNLTGLARAIAAHEASKK